MKGRGLRARAEARPEARPAARSEARPEARPEARLETREEKTSPQRWQRRLRHGADSREEVARRPRKLSEPSGGATRHAAIAEPRGPSRTGRKESTEPKRIHAGPGQGQKVGETGAYGAKRSAGKCPAPIASGARPREGSPAAEAQAPAAFLFRQDAASVRGVAESNEQRE